MIRGKNGKIELKIIQMLFIWISFSSNTIQKEFYHQITVNENLNNNEEFAVLKNKALKVFKN